MSQTELSASIVPRWNERNTSLSPQHSNLILSSSNQCMDTTEVQNCDKIANPISNLKPTEQSIRVQITKEHIFKKQQESVPLSNNDGIRSCSKQLKQLIPLQQVILIN